jgi:5,10-methylene-tetrahydrofolate dehydrogenase/methenyl tetrahydrofolate cyclohydrolase
VFAVLVIVPLGVAFARCIELLDRLGVSLRGKHVVVVGRSNVVGLPLALLALHRDATVTVCHVHTPQVSVERGLYSFIPFRRSFFAE